MVCINSKHFSLLGHVFSLFFWTTTLLVLKHVDHGRKTTVEGSMTVHMTMFSYVLFDRRWVVFMPTVTEGAELTFLGLIFKTQNTGEPSTEIFIIAFCLKLAHPIYLC